MLPLRTSIRPLVLVGVGALVALQVGVAESVGRGAVLEVCAVGCPYTSIQAAVDDAVDGNTVLVLDGTYLENINLGGKAITVRSQNGPATTTIDGNGSDGINLLGAGHLDRPAARVEDTVILRNDGHGVASGTDLAALQLTRCDIRGNSGAGVRVGGGTAPSSPPTLTNCLISGNRQRGVYVTGLVEIHVVNSTVAANLADADGLGGTGILAPSGSTGSSVVNSIVWGNSDTDGSASRVEGVISVSFSDVQGGLAGTGIIDQDPAFVDPRPATQAPNATGSFHIGATSPCLDIADAASAPSDDVDGDPRPTGFGVDMGADEYGAWLFGDRLETGGMVFWSLAVS